MKRQVRKMGYAVRAIGRRLTKQEFRRAEKQTEREERLDVIDAYRGYNTNIGKLIAYAE